eukprot:NODE_7554_length_1569_cov_2.013176.p1 GENE.NODE_7554_length_1569_cov_2.013176~~NODE_7554_length_1569_cov_2.013176.p1  ORF type:complete len:404 (-),score=109.89 NODE_7554_length_1569_cov_2.013176:192-1403(-)
MAPRSREPEPEPSGRRRALLVGCNYGGTSAELRGCINDVRRINNLLISRLGFDRHSIRVLTDDQCNPHSVPTRANMVEGMRWLVTGARPGDVLFFHFSGHGGQALDPTYSEEDGYDETLCPTDFQIAGQIVDNEVFDTVCAPLPSGAKLTALMDCCHSGTALDLPFTWSGPGSWVEETNPCFCAADIQLVSGCEDSQYSADAHGRYGEPAGALTTAFCDCLERGSVQPHQQLLSGLQQHLRQRGHSQRPQLTSSQRLSAAVPFNIVGDIVPNSNPVLGRQFRKRKHPKMQFDRAFNDMLMAGAQGMLLGVMLSPVLDLATYGMIGAATAFSATSYSDPMQFASDSAAPAMVDALAAVILAAAVSWIFSVALSRVAAAATSVTSAVVISDADLAGSTICRRVLL